jgi:gentisate 1,2-dioxygenase
MTHILAPADVSHYYQLLAELSTVPFWQREEFTEPAGPERGHVWHWQDIYPELTRSRQLAADAASLQRRALILRNPGLTPPATGATPTIAAAYQMLFPGESAPVHAHSISAIRFGLAGSGASMVIDRDRVPMEPGDLILTPAGAGTATSIPAAPSPWYGWTASTSHSS